jgi:hypothetical protein
MDPKTDDLHKITEFCSNLALNYRELFNFDIEIDNLADSYIPIDFYLKVNNTAITLHVFAKNGELVIEDTGFTTMVMNLAASKGWNIGMNVTSDHVSLSATHPFYMFQRPIDIKNPTFQLLYLLKFILDLDKPKDR